jgi:hypothetical protein
MGCINRKGGLMLSFWGSRGEGTMKPRRGDITKDRVGTLSERHNISPLQGDGWGVYRK